MVQIQDIQQKIRDDIVAGVLPFGSRVTIAQLAERYGVSQMPIREALRALHGEGLLIIEPNRGARIRTVDREFIGNIFDIRSALEVLLIRKMVMRATPADVDALREIEARFEACIEAGDYESALRTNREFHTTINTVANNPDAVALLDRHWLLIAALWHRFDYGAERFHGVINDHRHLINAIAERDVEAAGTLMSAHVIKARHTLLARLQFDVQDSPERKRAVRRSKLRDTDSDALSTV
ncbi:transcriptional regulator, GntR family [Burkholderia sp. GAS332]|nr:transcriptional regulator, GntR family [Burkholderia sp. GAS332]